MNTDERTDDESAQTLSRITPEQNQLWTAHLRRLWEEGKSTSAESHPAEEVLDRLERKYISILGTVDNQRNKAAAESLRSRLQEIGNLRVISSSTGTDD